MSLLAFLLAAAAPVPAQTAVPADETLALGSDAVARMTLPARINGHGPFAFTIDTAAERSVVSDTVASALALPGAGRAILHGIEGRRPIAMVQVDTLRFGRREHHDIAAPVLPRGALGAEGLIGLDALAGETVLIDFPNNSIRIARSSGEAMIGDPDVIVVSARSRFGQLILTDCFVGKTKVHAIIDTGAQNTLGNLALRRLLGRQGPLVDKGARVIGVTGATLVAETGVVPRIRLGSLAIAAMPVSYADVDTFRIFEIDDRPAILIGMDVLRNFRRVALDFRRRTVRFQLGDGRAAPILRQAANAAEVPERKGTRRVLRL